MNILSLTSDNYSNSISNQLGKGAQHAKLLYREWFLKGNVLGDHPAFRNAQSLLKKILCATDFTLPLLRKKAKEDETEKYILSTTDDLQIEMVALPMKAGWTLCISSQVGCRMGCSFCETGKMGLIRHLETEEIVAQVFLAKHQLGIPIRNIVFMGMGEPLDNYEAVMRAVNVLTDPNGFGFGPSRLTLSTSGCVDKIYRLIEEADPALNLAVSVNAPNDAVRNRLMPVNRSYDMHALKQAMIAYCKHPRRRIFIEYVLIAGRNDALEHAEQLAKYLCDLRVTVNLIPYNPQSLGCFKAPSQEIIDAFAQSLRNAGYLVFVRDTKGQKIMAACGQLGGRKKPLVFSS